MRSEEAVQQHSDRRSTWFCGGILGIIVICLLGLGARCVYLQSGFGQADWQGLAERQHSQVIGLPGRRGSILDRHGRVLANSVRGRGVFADPAILADGLAVARKLGAILGVDSAEMGATIQKAKSRRFVWLARDVSQETARQVRELGIRGVGVQSYQQREYPQGELAGQLLGFVGAEGVGLEGLERQFEAELGSRDGWQRRTADPGRRPLWSAQKNYEPVQDGGHVILTIDSVIQQFAEEQLGRACEKYQAKWGSAVVMDPHTGEVLAMASWPRFAPGNFAQSQAELRRNRCVTDVFEPGSTFKPFVASKALEAGLFGLDDKIFCHNGVYRTGSRTLHDHGAGYGELSFEDVVVHSSNIGMAIIGQRLKNKRLYEGVRDFGFGEKTGIDLAGESAGLVWPLDDWTSFSTTSVPMGQELAVTPLQLLRAFCAIANGGLLRRCEIVRKVISPSGELLWQAVPENQPRRVLSVEVSRQMRERVLANVVRRGTGTRAQLAAWGVFGKTGTSQVADKEKGGYLEDAFVGSFLGGAPIGRPRVCVLVSVGQPERSLGYYGGTVAAPAVAVILEKTLAYLGVEPEPMVEGEEEY